MTCKFDNLHFGQHVHLSGGRSCCYQCAANTQKQVESIKWIYQGHTDGADIFMAVSPFPCPGCGKITNWLAETCGERLSARDNRKRKSRKDNPCSTNTSN